MKGIVDTNTYCRTGSCVLLAPNVFDHRDEDGVVALPDAEPAVNLNSALEETSNICPDPVTAPHNDA